MPCSGNIAEICGGLGRINIFSHTPPVQVDPQAAWSSLGCYTFVMHGISRCCWMSTHVQPFSDSTPSRTLPAAAYTSSGNMTIQLCCDFCTAAGYKYAGVEYGIVSPFFLRWYISILPVLMIGLFSLLQECCMSITCLRVDLLFWEILFKIATTKFTLQAPQLVQTIASCLVQEISRKRVVQAIGSTFSCGKWLNIRPQLT